MSHLTHVKTIGTLEPSYVIQKFLDAQKIHNLTAYLQALHRKGLASEDHTTLLLNCYFSLCIKIDYTVPALIREKLMLPKKPKHLNSRFGKGEIFDPKATFDNFLSNPTTPP